MKYFPTLLLFFAVLTFSNCEDNNVESHRADYLMGVFDDSFQPYVLADFGGRTDEERREIMGAALRQFYADVDWLKDQGIVPTGYFIRPHYDIDDHQIVLTKAELALEASTKGNGSRR